MLFVLENITIIKSSEYILFARLCICISMWRCIWDKGRVKLGKEGKKERKIKESLAWEMTMNMVYEWNEWMKWEWIWSIVS